MDKSRQSVTEIGVAILVSEDFVDD